jgi:hypothetical protein
VEATGESHQQCRSTDREEENCQVGARRFSVGLIITTMDLRLY